MRPSAAVGAAGIAALLWAGAASRLSPIVFEDHARAARLDFVLNNSASPRKFQVETMPAGVGVIDYDNDAFEDLYFVNGAALPGLAKTDVSYNNRLFRNNGDGTFSDVTARAGVAGAGYSMAVAVGDYDNDGFDDLFVAGVNRDILYHNNGDGTFTDVTRGAGIAAEGPAKKWSISAGWFDYDNDGRLDLFVVNYCRWTADKDPYCGGSKPGYRTYCDPKHYDGLPNTLYRNNGDGSFTDVSVESGIAAHVGKGMSAVFADYDDDGRTDIFVANDTTPGFLFHNAGGGRFDEVGVKAGVAFNNDGQTLSGMGADFRDVDNDGLPDLIVTALSDETFTFYRNLGSGRFQDATYPSGLGLLSQPWSGWSMGIFDLDNDGLKDVFTANSHVMDNVELYSGRAYRQPNTVFANLGGARFALGGRGSSFTPRSHRGCAFGDFDNDGRIDVAVSSLNEPAELLLNVSVPRRHWIDLLLTGVGSNRDAVGARVKLVQASGATQWNQVTTAVGYASSSSRRVHFGLGSDPKIAFIEIRWPSGTVQRLTNARADRLERVTEDRLR
jgi:hypothetical protein